MSTECIETLHTNELLKIITIKNIKKLQTNLHTTTKTDKCKTKIKTLYDCMHK